jgi:hypothetical protein
MALPLLNSFDFRFCRIKQKPKIRPQHVMFNHDSAHMSDATLSKKLMQKNPVDFLLTAKRGVAAAKCFFDKPMGANGDPDKVSIDKSGADKEAIDATNAGLDVPILVRQVNTSATLLSRTIVPLSV